MVLSNLDKRCSQTCEMRINDRVLVRRDFRYQEVTAWQCCLRLEKF